MINTDDRTNKGTGFTLIEVLISITLLTIVLGAVYSSFFLVQKAVKRFDDVSLKYQEARTVLDMMRREIEGSFITTPQSKDITQNKTIFLARDRDILDKKASELYITTFSSRDGNLNLAAYIVEEKDKGLTLLKMEAPAINISTIFSKLHKSELIENINGFSVEMLFNDKWVRTWDSSQINKLPEMMRISIEFDDSGNNVKLTEYARPRIVPKIVGRQL
jgi:prepilin-type N-terminal cleavage/methylation domain-containing protein